MSLRICILETDILRPEFIDHYQGFVTDLHACLLANASFLHWRGSMGNTLKRHPFSGLVHSAGELLHIP